VRNLGVSLLFVLSLIAFFLTLEIRNTEQVRIEAAVSRPEHVAEKPRGTLLRNGNDGGLSIESTPTITPLKEFDLRKLEHAYRLGLVVRPGR
jgi:hypothetical protein